MRIVNNKTLLYFLFKISLFSRFFWKKQARLFIAELAISIIINAIILSKKLLSLIDFRKTQTFGIYKTIKVIVIY